MPLLMALVIIVPAVMVAYQMDDQQNVVVIDHSGLIYEGLESDKLIQYTESKDTSLTNVFAQEEYGDAFGFLVISPDIMTNPNGLELYTRGNSTMVIEKNIEDNVSKIISSNRLESYDIDGLDQIIADLNVSSKLKSYRLSETSESSDSPTSTNSMVSMALAYVTGFAIYMFIFMYGSMVMNGVIEEKSNRIVEVIVTSVRPFELMMGKILGVGLVALTQVGVWMVMLVLTINIALGVIGNDTLALVDQIENINGVNPQEISDTQLQMINSGAMGINTDMLEIVSVLDDLSTMVSLVGWFVLFFIGGYLLYSAMFAAIGSAVDNVMDTQQLQYVVSIPLIFSIIILMSVMNSPDSSLAFWASIIPFTSPIIMMARLSYGTPLWEVILSVVILYGSFIAMTYIASRIYRVGIFMYGKKPSLKELIKWSRFK